MKNGTIVLIDDNKVEAMLCREAFKEVNVENPLKMFHDGPSAFDYILSNAKNIFMIVCDISMPRMSGLELLEKINTEAELKLSCIPFVFFTNSALPSDVNSAYALSAQGYFQKPMDMDGLSRIFKDMLNYWNHALIPQDSHN